MAEAAGSLMGRRVLVGLVVVLAVAGCSSRVGGVPVPATSVGSESTEPAGTAAELLGGLQELDPCSLTSPEVFAAFGEAEWGAVDSLDYCNVAVGLDGGAQAVLSVGQLDDLVEHPNAPEVEELDSGLVIAQPDGGDDVFCTMLLVFADNVSLAVTGSVLDGETPQLCAMARAGIDEVVRLVEAGEVGRRDPPDGSLQPIDPCELLTDEVVAAQPGMAGSTRYAPPARHVCRWTASPGPQAMTVRVLFRAGVPPSTLPPGSSARPIAGRDTVVTPLSDVGSVSFCLVDAPHVAFESPGQDGLVEIASVWVRAEAGQVDRACQVATALAEVLWPLLPSP